MYTSKKLIKNNQQSKGKSVRYQPMDFKNLKKKTANQKYRDFCQVCDFQKENLYPRVWIKKSKENIWPSIWIFILCVITISGIWNRNTKKAGIGV
jgi:hypothetical protein